ncbi:hypothetical protein DFH06DRAFT_1374479 [Mycena polygramma]|nr:hypothetical protein DFH06DRAFT_1374479 [Mycena polygramma]
MPINLQWVTDVGQTAPENESYSSPFFGLLQLGIPGESLQRPRFGRAREYNHIADERDPENHGQWAERIYDYDRKKITGGWMGSEVFVSRDLGKGIRSLGRTPETCCAFVVLRILFLEVNLELSVAAYLWTPDVFGEVKTGAWDLSVQRVLHLGNISWLDGLQRCSPLPRWPIVPGLRSSRYPIGNAVPSKLQQGPESGELQQFTGSL